MSETRIPTQSLAEAGEKFARDFDEWVRRHRPEAERHGATRASMLEPQYELRNLNVALGWNLSVGLYGQSQCGKSMLVSCFGEGLGAKVSSDAHRSLLVTDTTPPEQRTSVDQRPRWYANDEEARAGGINFAEWFDPQNGAESTGVVCRFTQRELAGVKPGHLLVELMDVSEVVSSLALGFASEFKRRDDPDRQRKVVTELQRLQKAPREKDPEGIMGSLLHAWKFLAASSDFSSEARFRVLDAGHEGFGWDEFVASCLELGVRPQRSDRAEPSDLDRLVELLWDGMPAVTKVWKRLLRDILRLNQARNVLVRTEDVCTIRPRDTIRPSLLSVQWASRLFSDGVPSARVEPVDRPQAVQALSYASLHCLTRTLVLPVSDAAARRTNDASTPIDVIDYPGARDAKGDLDAENLDAADDFATQAFLRGKLNRLFIASVQYHDTSVLCLAIQGKDNLVAGKPIKAALRAWLRRENWFGFIDSDGDDFPASETGSPPLVIAVTKSDMAWPQAPNSFNERIKLIRSTYSDEAGFHWMQRWTRSGEPFSDLYWVHNSSFAKDGWRGDEARRMQTVRSCISQELLLQHTNDLERRLEALTGSRPEDVAHLFDRIRQLSDGPGRDGRLLVQLSRKLGEVVSAVNAIYIGEGDQDRKDKERELAEQHIRELRRTLAKTAPVAEFLSALAMTPEMVVRAFERAAQDAAGDDEGALGSVGFEDFYKSLCSIFVARFDKELDRDARWIRELSSDSDTKAKLCTRFKQFTGADWFRKPIESAADPIVASYDVSNTNVEALGSVVSAIWNRNMVWLGNMPPAPAGPEHRPPRLRSRFAASERILEHWSAHLAERYQQLSDPRNKTLPANVRLGEIRRTVRQSIGAFLGSEAATVSRGQEWSRAVEEIREMHAKLSEPELAAGA